MQWPVEYADVAIQISHALSGASAWLVIGTDAGNDAGFDFHWLAGRKDGRRRLRIYPIDKIACAKKPPGICCPGDKNPPIIKEEELIDGREVISLFSLLQAVLYGSVHSLILFISRGILARFVSLGFFGPHSHTQMGTAGHFMCRRFWHTYILHIQ